MKGFNIKYPIEDDYSNNNYFKMNETTNEGLVSNLYLLLLTRKGERYYNPDFGTDLLKFIFEPNDNITIDDIENSIKSDVEKYLPEITITNIEFNNDDENRNEYKISIIVGFIFNDTPNTEKGTIEINI